MTLASATPRVDGSLGRRFRTQRLTATGSTTMVDGATTLASAARIAMAARGFTNWYDHTANEAVGGDARDGSGADVRSRVLTT